MENLSISKEYSNDFCFGGEIVRWSEMDKTRDVKGIITVKGKSHNEVSTYDSYCEVPIYFRENAWNDLCSKKEKYDYVELCGHFEQSATRQNPIKFMCDMVVA